MWWGRRDLNPGSLGLASPQALSCSLRWLPKPSILARLDYGPDTPNLRAVLSF